MILAQGAHGDAAAYARVEALIDGIVVAQLRWLPGAILYVLLVRGEPRARWHSACASIQSLGSLG